MTLPAQVILQFQAIPPNPRESDLSGAYNKLLNCFFPPDTDFTVTPQCLIPSLRSRRFIVSFAVFHRTSLVFVLQVKTPTDLMYISSRRSSDQWIREVLGDFADQCPIPTLHAVSAMGTRLCFYQLDTTNASAEIVPRSILQDPIRVTDTAPAEWWDCDILDANGEERLRVVVDLIKEACKNIPNA
ncbi:hypothetical protein EDD16DRAFT_1887848 [Pisolithus croceorrhizus]|nr:hypothetical protein EDD16DRAFT_1887848 [Pisolithus croceorrhizus]KAI6116561.1 hypothetical protein EV401DRAFT_1973752 [Pisolithus croceorrhizus]KAI6159423.1 hypothetical protein EDD17DRAFT_1612614 [Pisolithus thermaeus]